MAQFRLGRDEVMLADMSPPARTMLRPIIETVALTAVLWAVVGIMDRPEYAVDPLVRNSAVALWALLVVWRFVWPLVRTRGNRFVVTNQRIVILFGASARVESIPLVQVRGARRYRGGMSLALIGYGAPMYIPNVGRAKRVEQIINARLP